MNLLSVSSDRYTQFGKQCGTHTMLRVGVVLLLACYGLLAQPADSLDNARLVTEAQAGKSADELLSVVMNASRVTLDLSASGIRMLKDGGVADKAITAAILKNGQDVDNQTLVSLSAAAISPKELVRLIRVTPADKAKFDASAIGLAGLTGAGVDRSIVDALDQKLNKSLIDQDEDVPVLAALGSRFSGGTIIGNGPLEITPAIRDENGMITTQAAASTQQFSQAATYLAFEMQPVWRLVGNGEDPTVTFSPIVNTRLTTIAVANPSLIEAPGESFLQSQKAVQFQFGGVLDLHGSSFVIGKRKLRWSVGPIARFIQQSVTDSQRTTRIWNLEDDLFEAWTAGLRLSLFHHRQIADSKAWRPVAYIDISRGGFENYEYAVRGKTDAAQMCLVNPSTCLISRLERPAGDDYEIENRHRLYIESRLMLKYVYLGFDINSGPQIDDVRFIGGLTLSLDRFFKKEN